MIFDGYDCCYSVEDDVHTYKLNCDTDSGNVFLDFKFVDRKSKVLVVCFSGAYPNIKDKDLPFYTGVSFSKKLSNVSFLFVSDPALYLDGIRLGWYAGTKDFNLQKILPDFINYFIQESCSDRVVFFGGSGGGFASLYYSRYVDNSVSIVWNPQIKIQSYDVAKWRVIDSYARAAFGVDRTLLSNYIDTDLASIYSRDNYKNRVIYLQNLTDHHVVRDLRPFLRTVFDWGFDCSSLYSGHLSKNFYLHLTDWAENHRPPPREALYYLLERITRPDLAWPNDFSKILVKAEKLVSRIGANK